MNWYFCCMIFYDIQTSHSGIWSPFSLLLILGLLLFLRQLVDNSLQGHFNQLSLSLEMNLWGRDLPAKIISLYNAAHCLGLLSSSHILVPKLYFPFSTPWQTFEVLFCYLMLIPYLCCYHYVQKSSSKARPPLPLSVHHLEQTPSLFALLFHPHFTVLLPRPSGFTLVRSCSHSHLALPVTLQVSSPTSSPHQNNKSLPSSPWPTCYNLNISSLPLRSHWQTLYNWLY